MRVPARVAALEGVIRERTGERDQLAAELQAGNA